LGTALPSFPFNVAKDVGAVPVAWMTLKNQLPHEVWLRGRRFYTVMREDGHGELGEKLLTYLASWCLPDWNARRDLAPASGENVALKAGCRAGFVEAAERFGDFVPPFFWVALNEIISERPGEPDHYLSILAIKDQLKVNWAVADAAIHAAGITTDMLYTISGALSRNAGVIFRHGCDCGCGVSNVGSGTVAFTPRPEEISTIALQWWSHFFAVLYNITVNKLPFRFGLSPDALRALSA
jgi:hypothetical protein